MTERSQPKDTTRTCCTNAKPTCCTDAKSKDTTGNCCTDAKSIYESVQEYYGKVLSKTSDLKTCACTTCGPLPKILCNILSKFVFQIL